MAAFTSLSSPVDIHPGGGGGSSLTVDVSAHVVNASGVLVRIYNSTGTLNGSIKWRGFAAATVEESQMADNSHLIISVGLDAANSFILYLSAPSSAYTVELLGYYNADDVVFLADPSVVDLSDNSWRTVDISSLLGADSCVAVLLSLDCNSSSRRLMGARMTGSSDDIRRLVGSKTSSGSLIIGTNASNQFDIYQESTNFTNIRLLAYFKSGVTSNLNATPITLTSDTTWESIGTSYGVAASFTVGLLADTYSFGLRSSNYTGDLYGIGSGELSAAIMGADNGEIEAKVSLNDKVTFYHTATIDADGGGAVTHEADAILLTGIQTVTSKQAVFGADAGFVVDGGISQGSQAQFETAALIAQQLGLQASLGSFINASSSFGMDAQMLSVAVGNLIAQSTLDMNNSILNSSDSILQANALLVSSYNDQNSSNSVLQANSLLVSSYNGQSSLGSFIESNASIGIGNTITSLSQADYLASSLYNIVLGTNITSNSDLTSSISLGSLVELSSLSGLGLEAAASLIVNKALSTNLDSSIEGTTSYAMSCALAAQAVSELTSSASFDIVSGLISQTQAVLLAQAQLNTGSTFSVISGQNIEAYGTLTVTSSIDASGLVSVSIEITPLQDGHNVIVTAQDRTVIVSPQLRNVNVL